MTTTAERIAELTAAWEDAVNYGAAPEDRSRASDYSLSEDDWRVGLSDDEAAEIVALIQQREDDREKAERIAREVWKDHMLNGGSIQDMLTAAALTALTETENAR